MVIVLGQGAATSLSGDVLAAPVIEAAVLMLVEFRRIGLPMSGFPT
jgi:hypothetical protein